MFWETTGRQTAANAAHVVQRYISSRCSAQQAEAQVEVQMLICMLQVK